MTAVPQRTGRSLSMNRVEHHDKALPAKVVTAAGQRTLVEVRFVQFRAVAREMFAQLRCIQTHGARRARREQVDSWRAVRDKTEGLVVVVRVNTTPQMTCFRSAKVCTKWLQGKVMMN